jgi:hypothetical protein
MDLPHFRLDYTSDPSMHRGEGLAFLDTERRQLVVMIYVLSVGGSDSTASFSSFQNCRLSSNVSGGVSCGASTRSGQVGCFHSAGALSGCTLMVLMRPDRAGKIAIYREYRQDPEGQNSRCNQSSRCRLILRLSRSRTERLSDARV